MSMVWPTLGSRTAKEQNRTDFCNNWSPTALGFFWSKKLPDAMKKNEKNMGFDII